jgi:starch phosphorylase
MATTRSKQAKDRQQATSRPAEPSGGADPATLLAQYGCGPVQFSGTSDALYERHLLFDSVRDLTSAGARERFEAVAHSVRDVLSQRWIRTEQTYERENPKRIYYLSMEFLIGRSLANNVMNLLLDPIARRVADEHRLDWLGLLEQEPDAGLGNGGLGRLAACSLESMATMQLPAMGTGSATSTACSGRRSRAERSASSRTTGSVVRTHGRWHAPTSASR